MKITRREILEYLQEQQKKYGSFTGQDITELASVRALNTNSLRKRIKSLMKSDPQFQGLNYRGQRTSPLFSEDYDFINDCLDQNPLITPSAIMEKLNHRRVSMAQSPIPERTAYRVIEGLSIGLDRNRADPMTWFRVKKITVSPNYSIKDAREVLGTLFTYRQLTTPKGISLRKTMARLQAAEEWYQNYYPDVAPHDHYDEIRPRTPFLPGLLSSIPSDRIPAVQGRFIFELESAFLVEVRDFLITQIRFRVGRFQQAINADLKKEQCQLLQERIDRNKRTLQGELENRGSPSRKSLEKLVSEPDIERDLAKANLRLRRSKAYTRLFDYLSLLTKQFHPSEISYHNNRARLLLRLARGEVGWSDLTPDEQTSMGKNRCMLSLIKEKPKQDVLFKVILTERLIAFLHHGKLTLTRSWEYQDLGSLVEKTPLPEDESAWPLSRETLISLISDQYQVNLDPLRLVGEGPIPEDEITEEDEVNRFFDREDFSTMALEVHNLIRQKNPDWFDDHKRIIMEAWDGCFRMDYTENEFAKRLISAIGFLGRNCRYRDDPAFRGLDYFIRRVVTPMTLENELNFSHRTLSMLTGKTDEVLLSDTIGIEGRRTNPLSTYHPRYHTRGIADIGGIGGGLIPVYSTVCSSRETEAMNSAELVARANHVLGGSLRFFCGDSHTVSMVSAGLLFGSFGVISAGYLSTIPDPPRPLHLRRLEQHLEVLNKVFMLMREKPELGRLFCPALMSIVTV